MTGGQLRVLSFIQQRHAAGLPSPSLQEIADAVGYSGRSPAHAVVWQLVEAGWLRRNAHRARGLEVIRAPEQLQTEWLRAVSTDALRAELARRAANDNREAA